MQTFRQTWRTWVLVVVFTGAMESPAWAEDYSPPAPGLKVLVGEHRLHIYCSGAGQPTVVLDAGLGGSSLDWTRVQPRVAGFTRVCAYDRAGYGWSENGPLPRTSRRLAEELHILLDTIAVPNPYVLVGHSFGGLVVRDFASRFSEETAGIVLVDATHENQFARYRDDEIARDITPSRLLLGANRPSVPNNIPADVLPIARRLAANHSAFIALQGEIFSFLRSAWELRLSAPLPDTPLVVISRGKRAWPNTPVGNRMEKLWEELQDDLAYGIPSRRSHSQPRHVVAQNSGHYVHLDEPEVVVTAIWQIVSAYRRHRPKRKSTT